MIQQVFQNDLPCLKKVLTDWVYNPAKFGANGILAWEYEDSFEGFLHLGGDLKIHEVFEPVIQINLESINQSRKMSQQFQTAFQYYIYRITTEGMPYAQERRQRGIASLNKNLLNYLRKKHQWKNFEDLDYPAYTCLELQTCWSPFRTQLIQDLINQEPGLLLHLNKITPSSDYNQKTVLYAIAEAAPEYFAAQASQNQKDIVAKLKETDSTDRHLAKLENIAHRWKTD